MPEPFGELLRRKRLAAGLPLSELARRINYSKGQVSKIENGHAKPSPEFARLCDNVLATDGSLVTALAAREPGISAAHLETLEHERRFGLDAHPGIAPTPPRLRAVPLAVQPLTSHAGAFWGAWGQVDGQSVLATGGKGGFSLMWQPHIGGDVVGRPTGSFTFGAWGQLGDHIVLATGGIDAGVRLWDPQEFSQQGEPLIGGDSPVLCGAWGKLESRPVLAAGESSGVVRLWDPLNRIQLGKLKHDTADPIHWVSWGHVDDKPVLATGDVNGLVQLWDPRSSTTLGKPFTGGTGGARWGAWGQVDDEAVLATGDFNAIRFWDPRNGLQIGKSLVGHIGGASWGVWGQIDDWPVLATGGTDGTVRLWDPQSRSALGEPLTGDSDEVHLDELGAWGAWGQVDDRPVLATSDSNGIVRLWEMVEDRPVPRWSTYRSDVSESADELARVGDAVALAELVTARSARPPLAVGLFGDWGEGKSHFLSLIRDQVRVAARPDNTLTHDAVRQVWFNAWHYAETDLWASLVAELFAQLSKPVDDHANVGSEQRSQSRLTAELVTERGLRERLAAARARHEDLSAALRRVDPDKSWNALSDEQKQRLRDLGALDPETLYRTVIRVGATFRETGRSWWQLVRSRRPRNLAIVAVWLLILVAGTTVVAWGVPWVERWVAALPAIVTVLTVAAFISRIVHEAKTRAGKAWRAAVQLAEGQEQRLRTAAEVSAAEVAELEREVQDLTAAGQLAGLVAETAASASYRGRLGVMTQIREDFQRMAQLLARADRDRAGDRLENLDEAGDPLPRISRIVLYVDDLDRCPPHRVVEMLEAIHLLLAVELFVVVVAVDPRWLLRSIAAHYPDLVHASESSATATHDMVDPDDEELWRSTPAQYLEKIFQVVLTLPPLDTHGYQRMLRTLVGTREDVPPPAPTPVNPGSETATSATVTEADKTTAHGTSVRNDAVEDNMFRVRLPAARIIERVDPLTLEPDELTLLDLQGPPLLITTPRGVKRLANSYGLLTAIRRDHRADDLAERLGTVLDQAEEERPVAYHPYRAGLVLLGVLVAYPALGPAILLHLYHSDGRNTWDTYLDNLTPTNTADGWTNAAAPTMTAVRAAQWHALVTALRQVTANAAARNLPLPEPLSAWQEWIVPVGRLSFPAGHFVNTLDRQPPLPREP